MIGYNNEAPKAVNNVGQFGATEGSIGAYKSAAEYAADAKYWALLSQTKYSSVEEILDEVERLYAQGRLLEEDIKQLKNDFEAQEQILLGLIQSTGTAIDNTNAATELSKEATQKVLEQLDIISNMTVQTTLLPPGSLATGSYDNATGVFAFGIPEGKPGRDGTDGTISDIGSVPVGVPVVDDYGFYVDKDDGGLYRADMSDIANLIPSVRSVSINGGAEQTGSVVFDSVSTFNGRKGDVVPQSGDYTAAQVGAFSVSNNLSEITNTSQAIKNIGLADYGIATNSLAKLSSFDWQTFVFTNSARYYVDYSAMTNRPEGLTYSSDTGLFIEVIGVVGSAFEVRIVPFTAANGKYITYTVRGLGTIGSRTFMIREELSSAIPVTISQGGTGATTASAARTNLGLGLVSTESIVPILKGGTGATSATNARLALVAAKSGDNSDITSFSQKVSFSQPVTIEDAELDSDAASLGQVKTFTNNISQSLSAPDGFKNIGSCSTIAQLRSIEPTVEGQRIYVNTHTTGIAANVSGDTGGGWFIAKLSDTASIDDNGIVIVTTGGKRWKRDLSDVRGITPKMFGAWMDAPYIDGRTIQGGPYPKAPSMGAAVLTGVHNDGSQMQAAYKASIAYNLPLLIEQPIYMGTTRIDISLGRFEGDSLKLIGDVPRRSIIYTSGNGGFYCALWAHNMEVRNIAFRNADEDYTGSPLLFGNSGGQGGGGKLYHIENVEFYHYLFALPTLCFVSVVQNIYMYDCTYGLAMAGNTSTTLNSIWAHHCDVGYLWGYGVDTTTLQPIAGGYPVMYVTASNIAADGCITPHKIGGQLRSVTIDGIGIEGINGTVAIDARDYAGDDDQFTFNIRGLSCWIQSSMNPGVTRFIELPSNESRMPSGSIVFESGYLKADYTIQFATKTTSGNIAAFGNSLVLGDEFQFIKATDSSRFSANTIRSTTIGDRVYGDAPLLAKNSYDGTTLSAVAVNSSAFFDEVKTEQATVILPWNRALDILITTQGEEARYGSCFVAGEVSLVPVSKTGLNGQESGGIVQFSMSGNTQENLASGQVWWNKLGKSTGASSTSLDGVSVSKIVKGTQTFLRISCPTANVTQFICHLNVSYSGFAHYYDRRWSVNTI